MTIKSTCQTLNHRSTEEITTGCHSFYESALHRLFEPAPGAVYNGSFHDRILSAPHVAFVMPLPHKIRFLIAYLPMSASTLLQ